MATYYDDVFTTFHADIPDGKWFLQETLIRCAGVGARVQVSGQKLWRFRGIYHRDFTPDDVRAAHAFDSDPELVRYRGGGRVTEEDTHAFIQRTQHWLRSEPRPIYALAIILKE